MANRPEAAKETSAATAEAGERVKLETCRETAREFSAKASEITRTLCYSGIAVIWVFRNQASTAVALPQALYPPGFFIVLALALDLFHYVTGALIWQGFARLRELRGVHEEAEFKAPRQLNWVTGAAFLGKVGSVTIAYFLLLKYLVSRFT